MATKKKAAKRASNKKSYKLEDLSYEDKFILNTTTDETLLKFPHLDVKKVNQRRAYLRMKLNETASSTPARWLNGLLSEFPTNWNPASDNNNNSSSAAQATKTEEELVDKVATRATVISGTGLNVDYFGTQLFLNGELTLNHVSKISIDGNKVTVE